MTRKTKNTLVSTALLAIVLACAFFLPMGCASLGGPDIEQKLIAAASKCIADASTILAAQREAAITAETASSLLSMQREANTMQLEAAKACKTPDPAAAMPLQSRKP